MSVIIAKDLAKKYFKPENEKIRFNDYEIGKKRVAL